MTVFTRRGFLVSGTALAGGCLVGLPLLAQEAANLPALEQRLPESPLVITPTERPGQQGGTWNHALVGGGSMSMLVRYQAYEPLVRFTPDWSGVEPNVALSYEVSEDARTYTFTLRRGHKWSDGHPVTAEDFVFGWQHLLDPENASKYAYMLYPVVNAEAVSWHRAGYSVTGSPANLALNRTVRNSLSRRIALRRPSTR